MSACSLFFTVVILILILKMYLHTEVARLRHSKLLMVDKICMVNEKYFNSFQGQRSRSDVTNFQPLLALAVGHIPSKLHQFLFCSFQYFVWIVVH